LKEEVKNLKRVGNLFGDKPIFLFRNTLKYRKNSSSDVFFWSTWEEAEN